MFCEEANDYEDYLESLPTDIGNDIDYLYEFIDLVVKKERV